MKVAIIYNQDMKGVINTFGMQNKEIYNAKTVKKVAEALEKGGHNVAVIDGNMNVIENLQNFMPRVFEGERLGMVFNMAYGIQGESRYTHIPSMLEMLGIPYVGSSPSGHALALDKVLTKIIMQKHNIPTPDFWVFSKSTENVDDVRFPAIVKPKMESVSFGLKIVNNVPELREAIEYVVTEFKQQALVEKFIRGREFAVGLLGNDPVETFEVLEIDLEGDPDAIQSATDKRQHPRAKICPARLLPELTQKMKDYSMAAFQALQLRDFARVDIRLDENGEIYLLEINSMASLGVTGSYVYAAQVNGYDYTSLVNKMLGVAVSRYFTGSDFFVGNGDSSLAKSLHIKVRTYIRGKQNLAERFLKEITDLNTYFKNVEGVNQLGNILKKQLTLLGFKHEVFPQVEIGNVLFFTNSESNDYDIMLVSHLDNGTRIERQDFFAKVEQKLFGTGIWENKGGLISMLLALYALRFANLLDKMKIGILLTSDNSLQGRFSRTVLKNRAGDCKYFIGLHGAFLNGGVITSRSGVLQYKCYMNLRKTNDVMSIPKAIASFTNLLTQWTNLSNAEEGLIISPNSVRINSSVSDFVVQAETTLNVRFSSNKKIDEIDKQIRKLLPAKSETIHYQIEAGEPRAALECTENVERLWLQMNSIAKELDIRFRKEHSWDATEIFLMDNDRCMIDGLGPVGVKEYDKKEYILKHSIIERATLLALTLARIGINE